MVCNYMGIKEWKVKQFSGMLILFSVHCQWEEMVNDKGCAARLTTE